MFHCRQSGLFVLKHIRNLAQKFDIVERRNIKRWVAPTLVELQRRKSNADPLPEQPRSTYLEWNYDAELYSFGKRLSEDFDQRLIKRALTHRTYANLKEIESDKANTQEQKLEDNWEMIKEGSEIISRCIHNHYSKKYPEDISQAIHDYLTDIEMLSHVGLHIGLRDIILTSEFPIEKLTLSDTFKAIVCALKESQGVERCNLFIKDFLICQIHDKDIDDIWRPENPYQYLQEVAKQKGLKEIEPRLCSTSAVNTILANYQVGIYSDKKLLGIGWGENIDTAKNTAALSAIYKIYKLAI